MIHIISTTELVYTIDPHGTPWKTQVEPLILALGTWDTYESPFSLFQYGEMGQDSHQSFNLADLPIKDDELPTWDEFNIAARNEMVDGVFHFERDCGLWREALAALVIRGDMEIPPNTTFHYMIWW